MLAVIQDNQSFLLVQIFLQDLKRQPARLLPETDRRKDSLRNQIGMRQGSQLYEPDTVVEFFQQVGRDLKGEARLACAARTGQCDQAVRLQFLADFGDLILASDKGGEMDRKIVRI